VQAANHVQCFGWSREWRSRRRHTAENRKMMQSSLNFKAAKTCAESCHKFCRLIFSNSTDHGSVLPELRFSKVNIMTLAEIDSDLHAYNSTRGTGGTENLSCTYWKNGWL